VADADFVQGEYDYLRARQGRDFFLALAPYANALHGRPAVREILTALEDETRQALERFAGEQDEMIEEAKVIRLELAERAPEVDNSDMERPHPASHDRAKYDLESFANFDRLADADVHVGCATIPSDSDDPGNLSTLLIILRGRMRAAEYGEDAPGFNAERIRDDLGDLGRRIGNLGERHRAFLQRYRQESRTLPGMAYARLVYFGSNLVADPVQIETDEDVERFLDRSLREWGQPKTLARKFANGERLEDWEARSIAEIEETLKDEADRLHREIVRRLPAPQPESPFSAFPREHTAALVVTVVGTIAAALILVYAFGIGD